MTVLHTFDAGRPEQAPDRTDDPEAIAVALRPHGVRFERWPTVDLPEGADPATVLEAYAEDVARIRAEGGYATADCISLAPDHPDRDAIRARFLAEHRHTEDEVRFFVRGAGEFYLHLAGRVFALRCERGDLLSVPDGTPHWFDTGPAPSLTAIRIFTDPSGWTAEYTGSDIATRFPTMDDLA